MSGPGTETAVATAGAVGRCAVHPGRLAVDTCPVCARPRCGADASSAPGGGCRACGGRTEPTDEAVAAAHRWERLIAAALVLLLLIQVGGRIASEYVGSQGFAEITPFLIGLACGASAAAVVRTHGRGRDDVLVRAFGAVAAVLATALSFRLVPGGQSPFSPAGTVLGPYVSAIAGAFASRLFR